MSESKHTPGPWTIIPARPYDGDEPDLDGSFESFASIEGSDGSPVCMFGDAAGSATMFENEADYCLIAAAPELLAALKSVSRKARELSEDTYTSNRGLWAACADEADAAIAIAEALPIPAEGAA